MAKPQQQYRAVTFFELVSFLRYLETNYGAVAEIHISTDEDDPRDALLCVTCVGVCKLHPNPRYNTFASCKVSNQELHLVPFFLQTLLYEISDQLDGQCPQCLAKWALLN